MTSAEQACPVCGFEPLTAPAWDDDEPSFDICPSCGTQFGHDDAADDALARTNRHARLRTAWVANGCPWYSKSRTAPTDWDPQQQLAALGR
jgi:hypothetical protein